MRQTINKLQQACKAKRVSISRISLIIISLFTSSQSFAIASHHEQGTYVGFIVGVSIAPTFDFFLPQPLTDYGISVVGSASQAGRMSYSAGGLAGAQLGYRCGGFRFEIEGMYNYNQYYTLTLNNSLIIYSPSTSTEMYLDGGTGTTGGLVNIYYEFQDIFHGSDGQPIPYFPYFGVGVGYGYVTNTLEFYSNGGLISVIENYESLVLGQAIAGFGRYLDDFTTVNLDFRYIVGFGGSNMPNFPQTPEIFSVNLTINGAFDFSKK